MAPRLSLPLDDATGWRFLYETWQPLTLFLLTLVFTTVFYTNYKSTNANEVVCDTSGNIQGAYLGYNPLWDVQEYFSINIVFGGQLSYTHAKIIDACWDVLFGRGGQMVVGMVAYRVIRSRLP